MKLILTTLSAAAVFLFASCKKSDDNQAAKPPIKTEAYSITINNLNVSNVPTGVGLNNINVSIYSTDSVLLASTGDQSFSNLPVTRVFGVPRDFNYNFKTLNIKFEAYDGTGSGIVYPVGNARLTLDDYSSDTYPQPKELFFNQNGCAGTLKLNYYD